MSLIQFPTSILIRSVPSQDPPAVLLLHASNLEFSNLGPSGFVALPTYIDDSVILICLAVESDEMTHKHENNE